MRVLSIGKDKGFTADGVAEYEKRLARTAELELVELKAAEGPDAAAREGALLLAAAAKVRGAQVWALDRTGAQLASPALAQRLGQARDAGTPLALCIGGDEGLAPAVLAAARFTWSLSSLTLPHRLARLLVLEQVYRGLEILRGSPYHK